MTRHNLQPERQARLPSKEQASLEKRYLKARDRIWEALGYEWWPSARGTANCIKQARAVGIPVERIEAEGRGDG